MHGTINKNKRPGEQNKNHFATYLGINVVVLSKIYSIFYHFQKVFTGSNLT